MMMMMMMVPVVMTMIVNDDEVKINMAMAKHGYYYGYGSGCGSSMAMAEVRICSSLKSVPGHTVTTLSSLDKCRRQCSSRAKLSKVPLPQHLCESRVLEIANPQLDPT